MTYLPTFYKFQAFRKFLLHMHLIRKISLEGNASLIEPIYKRRIKGNYFISPQLTPARIQEVTSVTGITLGLNYISWIQMSVPTLNIINWNLKVLPFDFRNPTEESHILNFAYDVKKELPDSDLYIMEPLIVRECKSSFGIYKICLSSMLTVLLNGFKKDTGWKDKVIFQKKFVMNYLYNIQIASERISTRSVVENILFKPSHLSNLNDSSDSSCPEYTTIKVDCDFVQNFKESDLEKQENLSLALLLTLSFIDVNLFKNEKSLQKILKRKKYYVKS